jgi:hypothetical protein
MRCIALAVVLASALAPEALAEPAAAIGDNRDGLPGLGRVGAAAPPPAGWAVAWTSGYGYTESVLGGGDDAHHRVGGILAASVRLAEVLAVGLRLDGRYDKHTGGESDDGWIGDTRVTLRAGRASGRAHLGAQLVLWLPGDAPLVPTADGASGEATALLDYAVSPSLRLVANGGFRLDRSAGSVPNADRLSDADRMALGVSDASAVLLGVGAVWRSASGTEVYGEGSWDLLIGSDAPPAGESPIRIGAGVRVGIGAGWAFTGGVEASLSSRPPVGPDEALVPIEPRFALNAGLRWRFGGPAAAPRGEIREVVVDDGTAPVDDGGTVRGRILAPDGRPLVGATVTVGDVSTVTDDDGTFELEGLPPGKVTIDIGAVPPYAATTATATVGDDAIALGDISVERELPPGQIRGVVHTAAGAPVAARIRIEPIGKDMRAGKDGAFRVDVPPGKYEVVIDGPGLAAQRRRIEVAENGVTVLNVELRAEKQRR